MGAAQLEQTEIAAQLAEIFADFRDFCGLLEIATKSDGRIVFRHDRWHEEQEKFDRERSGRDVVIKPRQIGFSTLELARDLWFALTHEGVQVLVVAHDAKLVQDLFGQLKIMADSLSALGLLPETKYDNKRELYFRHLRSVIRVVEAGDTPRAANKKGRSGTIHRLHATEVAFWDHGAITWNGLTACVPDDGEIVVESTANGVGGLFYRLVTQAREGNSELGFKLHFFAWFEHQRYRLPPPADFDPTPRDKYETRLREQGCDDQQIAWWRSKVATRGLDLALQEYPCDLETCFRMPGRAYIRADVLDAMAELVCEPIARIPITWNDQPLGDLLVYERPQPRVEYIVPGDVAEGESAEGDDDVPGDGSAACVLRRDTGAMVATFRTDRLMAGDFGLALAVIGWMYNTARVAPERNNHGHASIRALQREAKYPRIYRHEDGKLGWPTTPATRPLVFEDLRRALEDGSATTPDAATLAECRTLIVDTDGKPRAQHKGRKDGCHDDRFVAWGIGWQVRTRPEVRPKGFRVRGV